MSEYISFEEIQHEEEVNYYHALQRTAENIFEQGLTKAEIKPLAEILVNNVLTHGNPLAVAENMKVLKEIIKSVEEERKFKDYCLEEIAKHGKSYTSPRGAVIEPMEAGIKYNYENCNDPVYKDLIEQKEGLDEKIKQREKFLKAIDTKGEDFINLETGEAYKIYPPYKTSTSTYKITLK